MSTILRRSEVLHILQAVGELVKPLLASPTSSKCIIDDDQNIITNCTAQIVQNVDIQHAVGRLINSCIQAHHRQYRTGCTTLVVMATLLGESMDHLLQQGIPTHDIVEVLQYGLELCCSNLDPVTVPLESILQPDVPPQRHQHSSDRTGQHQSHASDDPHLPTQLHPQNNQDKVEFSNRLDEQKDFDNLEIEFKFSPNSNPSKIPGKELRGRASIEMNDRVGNPSCITKRVDLKLDGIKKDEHVDDEDDVGWFFEDGCVPDVPVLDDPLVALLHEKKSTGTDEVRAQRDVFPDVSVVLSKSGSKGKDDSRLGARFDVHHLSNSPQISVPSQNSAIKNNQNSSLESTRANVVKCLNDVDEVIDDSHPLPSINHESKTDSEDEFEDCIDDIRQIEKPRISPAKLRKRPQSFGLSIGFSPHAVTDTLKSPLADEIDDEFDSCFEDVEHMDSSVESSLLRPSPSRSQPQKSPQHNPESNMDLKSVRPVPVRDSGPFEPTVTSRSKSEPCLALVATLTPLSDLGADEFEDCFENIDFVDSYIDVVTPEKVDVSSESTEAPAALKKMLIESEGDKPSEIASGNAQSIMLGKDQSSDVSAINAKLRELLAKKTCASASKTYNQSRHFKSFESTLDGLGAQSISEDKLVESSSAVPHHGSHRQNVGTLDVSKIQITADKCDIDGGNKDLFAMSKCVDAPSAICSPPPKPPRTYDHTELLSQPSSCEKLCGGVKTTAPPKPPRSPRAAGLYADNPDGSASTPAGYGGGLSMEDEVRNELSHVMALMKRSTLSVSEEDTYRKAQKLPIIMEVSSPDDPGQYYPITAADTGINVSNNLIAQDQPMRAGVDISNSVRDFDETHSGIDKDDVCRADAISQIEDLRSDISQILGRNRSAKAEYNKKSVVLGLSQDESQSGQAKSGIHTDKSPTMSEVDAMLSKVCKVKSEKQQAPKHSRILNQSRHIGTLTSCLDELQQNVCLTNNASESSDSTYASQVFGSETSLENSYQYSTQITNTNSFSSKKSTTDPPALGVKNDDAVVESSGDSIRRRTSEDLLVDLVRCLSHDVEYVEPLVSETVACQCAGLHWQNFKYDLSQVTTLSVCGPMPSRSSVVRGFITRTNPEQLSLITHSEKQKRRTLLINGDVRASYHHRGYNKVTDSHVVQQGHQSSTTRCWLKEVKSVIDELNVGAILVHGQIDPDVQDMCLSSDVIAIDGVNAKVICGLAEISGTEIAVYLTESTEDNIIDEVVIKPWREADWMDQVTDVASRTFAVIEPPTMTVQSVILCHPCEPVVLMNEEMFWHLAYRVHLTLKHCSVLNGGGGTEAHCAKLLQTKADELRSQPSGSRYTSAILETMSAAFHQFIYIIRKNTDCEESAGISRTTFAHSQLSSDLGSKEMAQNSTFYDAAHLYDDHTSKVEAWKAAVQLLSQLLLIELEIVTGLERSEPVTGMNIIGRL